MSFRPAPDHPNHIRLERSLCEICKAFSVDVVNVPCHALLSKDEKVLYDKNFSNEPLYIRSLPDKLVLTDPPFFVDAKTTVRKDTGNISIELSSFYFNLERVKMRIQIFYLYFDDEEKPKIFSPLKTPPSTIFIQPIWVGTDRQRFLFYASAIKRHFENGRWYRTIPLHEKDTEGSRDPFLLIPISTIQEYSVNLTDFLNLTRKQKIQCFRLQ